jgi:hypothetical protein
MAGRANQIAICVLPEARELHTLASSSTRETQIYSPTGRDFMGFLEAGAAIIL